MLLSLHGGNGGLEMQRLGPVAARVVEGVAQRIERVEELKRGHVSVPRIVRFIEKENIEAHQRPCDHQSNHKQ